MQILPAYRLPKETVIAIFMLYNNTKTMVHLYIFMLYNKTKYIYLYIFMLYNNTKTMVHLLLTPTSSTLSLESCKKIH